MPLQHRIQGSGRAPVRGQQPGGGLPRPHPERPGGLRVQRQSDRVSGGGFRQRDPALSPASQGDPTRAAGRAADRGCKRAEQVRVGRGQALEERGERLCRLGDAAGADQGGRQGDRSLPMPRQARGQVTKHADRFAGPGVDRDGGEQELDRCVPGCQAVGPPDPGVGFGEVARLHRILRAVESGRCVPDGLPAERLCIRILAGHVHASRHSVVLYPSYGSALVNGAHPAPA